MNRFMTILAALALSLLIAAPVIGADKVIKMSTTTSTQASGLLDILLPQLKADTGIEIKVIAKGTGAAIRDGMDGNVDVIFVHAKAREENFVKEGYGTKRFPVMHNDFVIVGPASDPAGIKGMTDAPAALKRIAQSTSSFVSRGDDSGTHTKEQALWKDTGLDLIKETKSIVKKGKKREVSFYQPKGGWYISIGQGMGKTLTYADEKQIYTLTDRGTYIKRKASGLDLVVLCEGGQRLENPYGVIPINPKKFAHVKYDTAQEFVDWLVSMPGQKLIADYKLLGQQLFFPDAIPDAGSK